MFRAFGRTDGGRIDGRSAADRGVICNLVYSSVESVIPGMALLFLCLGGAEPA